MRAIAFAIASRRTVTTVHGNGQIILATDRRQTPKRIAHSGHACIAITRLRPFNSPRPGVNHGSYSTVPVIPKTVLQRYSLINTRLSNTIMSLRSPGTGGYGIQTSDAYLRHTSLANTATVHTSFDKTGVTNNQVVKTSLAQTGLSGFFVTKARTHRLVTHKTADSSRNQSSNTGVFTTGLSNTSLHSAAFLNVSVKRTQLSGAQVGTTH